MHEPNLNLQIFYIIPKIELGCKCRLVKSLYRPKWPMGLAPNSGFLLHEAARSIATPP